MPFLMFRNYQISCKMKCNDFRLNPLSWPRGLSMSYPSTNNRQRKLEFHFYPCSPCHNEQTNYTHSFHCRTFCRFLSKSPALNPNLYLYLLLLNPFGKICTCLHNRKNEIIYTLGCYR